MGLVHSKGGGGNWRNEKEPLKKGGNLAIRNPLLPHKIKGGYSTTKEWKKNLGGGEESVQKHD